MKNSKGFTLVELLAVLALMSMIILLISTAHIFGQKQYINQSEQVEYQAEARVAMNQITRAIRNAEAVSVSDNELQVDMVTYHLQNNQLKKDKSVIAEGMAAFHPSEVTDSSGKGIRLHITTNGNRQGKATDLETVIYLRD